MADVFTPAKRSAVMALVRGKGNRATELRLMAVFRAHGITGWRRGATLRAAGQTSKGPKSKVGKRRFQVRPDFVFSARKLTVFVDGCFWHACPLHATQPKGNAAFWSKKLAANVARDRLVNRTLRRDGWRVLRIWEHELTRRYERRLLARLRRAGLLVA